MFILSFSYLLIQVQIMGKEISGLIQMNNFTLQYD